MAGSSFVRGAAILLLAAFINRILGFVFQAVVFRLIGSEGVGLFNMVYPVYVLMIVVTTAGIPLALSKMVAEETTKGNISGAKRIFHTALILLCFTGLLILVVIYFCLPLLLKYVFVNKKVYICFLSMLPGVFIVAVTSVFRGYYQGLQQMVPPAVSQVTEQITRVSCGLLLAYYFLPRGIEYAAAGVAAGGVLGELGGLSVLLISYVIKKRYPVTYNPFPPRSKILKEFAKLCTPITGGRILGTLLLSVDTFLIPSRLKTAGMTVVEATSQYGLLSGAAMTLLFVPTVVTISLATTLVPAVSEAMCVGKTGLLRQRINDAIRITIIAGMPFFVLFYTVPGQLTDMIYGTPGAANLLRILALGCIFLYLQQTTTGIVQGLGKPTVPLLNMAIAAVFKLALIYYFTAIPEYGINGTAAAYTVFYFIAALLNLIYLAKKGLIKIQWNNMLIKPGLAALVMFFVLLAVNRNVFILTKSNPLAVTSAGLLSGCIYIILLLYTGVITDAELKKLSIRRR